MTENIINYTGKGQITATLVNSDYIWIATKGTSGTCYLLKCSVYNPETILISTTIIADEITSIAVAYDYLYLSIDDSTNIGVKVSLSLPSSSKTYIVKPVGVTEKSVKAIYDYNYGDYVYFITPGVESGQYCKVITYEISTGIIVETYELSGGTYDISNVRRAAIVGEDGYLWICTFTSSPYLARMTVNPGSSSYEVFSFDSGSLFYPIDAVYYNYKIYVACQDNPAGIVEIDLNDPDVPVYTYYAFDNSGETAVMSNCIDINDDTLDLHIGCNDGLIVKTNISDLNTRTEYQSSSSFNIENIDSQYNIASIFAGTSKTTSELVNFDLNSDEVINTNLTTMQSLVKKLKTYLFFGRGILINNNLTTRGISRTQIRTNLSVL